MNLEDDDDELIKSHCASAVVHPIVVFANTPNKVIYSVGYGMKMKVIFLKKSFLMCA